MRLDHITGITKKFCAISNLKRISISLGLDSDLPDLSGNHPAIPGGYREVAIPVPIPNTEVKHLIANGTIWFAVWESRTLPGYYLQSYTKPALETRRAFLFSISHHSSRLRSMSTLDGRGVRLFGWMRGLETTGK